MDKLKYIKLENEDGSYSDSIPLSVDSDYVDVGGNTLTNVIAAKANTTTVNESINTLQNEINGLASGSPKGVYETTSALVAENPDTGVYVVSSNGHLYSWTKNASSAIDLGVYQAAEDSTTVTTLSHMVAPFAKFILNNTIEINIGETSTTISWQNSNQNTGIITENGWRSVDTRNWTPTEFPFTEYPIKSSGIWVITLDSNKQFHIRAANIAIGTVENAKDDVIIAVLRLGYWMTLCENHIRVNGIDISSGTKNVPMGIPILSYNRVSVTNDTVNKTFQVQCGDSGLVVYTGTYFRNLPSNYNQTISYDINFNSNLGNLIGVYVNPDNNLVISQLLRPSEFLNTPINYSTHKRRPDNILLFVYNVATQKIYPTIKNDFYYNGELISEDKVWNEITDIKNSINSLTLSKLDFMRCFKTFVGIGDSLMAGYTSIDGHTVNSATARAAKNNWLEYLTNRLGRECTNLAIGSSTAHHWRYHDQGSGLDSNIENANIENTDCYFMGIGVNDARGSLTVGSSADIKSDYTQNSDTFYGNYDYCINRLKIFNPYAKIFVFTIPDSENHAENYNAAIRYIANLYDNVYCIDLYDLYDYDEGFIAENFTGGHYNPIIYNYMSVLIENAINNYIWEHSEDFHWIPYHYE